MSLRSFFCALIFLIAVFAFETFSFRKNASITFDETFYLSCALQTVHDGSLDPRLSQKGVAPLPILLEYGPPLSMQPREARPHPWNGSMEDPERIRVPRIFTGLFAAFPLLILISLMAVRRHGSVAGILAGALLVFSPGLVAHSSIATTDIFFTFLVLLAIDVAAYYLLRPTRWRLTGLALAIAAAMAAKYSGFFLIAAVLPFFFFKTGQAPKPPLRHFALLVVLIFPLWWGFHLFNWSPQLKGWPGHDSNHLPEILTNHPLPSPLAGIVFQYSHNEQGHPAFLNGRRSDRGWWWFYPDVFLYKSTPVELALAVVALLGLLAMARSPRSHFNKLDAEILLMMSSTGFFLFFVSRLQVSAGQRYLLPLYPILILLAIEVLWRIDLPQKILFAAAGLLIASQAASLAGIHPYYLSYFNSFSGGPQNGWRRLVDSNFDWGQDLPALHRWLEKNPGRKVALAYFGTALPQAYGINADLMPDLKRPLDEYDELAVSTTLLEGVYLRAEDAFAQFRSLQPAARAGYSILLYDLHPAPAREAFQIAQAKMKNVETQPLVATDSPFVNLYQFAMTLLAGEDYPERDVFDLCYGELFADVGSAPAKLADVRAKLEEASSPDYRGRFRSGLLYAAAWVLAPRAVRAQSDASWLLHVDCNEFRASYATALKFLQNAGEVGRPLAAELVKAKNRIDANQDGRMSDEEIRSFLAEKP